MRVLKFILESIAPFKHYYLLPLLTVIFIACTQNLQSVFLKNIINAFANHDTNALFLNSTYFAVIPLIATLAWALSDWAEARIHPKLKCHIRITLLERLQQYHHQFFLDHYSGTLANKINDAQQVLLLLDDFLYTFLYQGLSFLIALFILVNTNVNIFLCTALFLILFISIGILTSSKAVMLSEEASNENAKISGHTVDLLTNLFNVKLFSSWHLEKQRALKIQEPYIEKSIQQRMYLQRIYIGLNLICTVYWLAIFALIYHDYRLNQITAGDIALILTMITWITDAQFRVFFVLRGFVSNWGSVSQALNLIEQPILGQDKEKARPLSIRQGEIQFHQVTFNYRETAKLFQEKTVTIPSGQKVGLVGYSGSGKSTFVHLILRLFEVKSGKITIDGQDITDITQDSLRRAIGMIPQDPMLFHRSLLENIRYGKEDATDEEVIEASKKAHAHEFIQALPDRYDALVGDRGVKLSGGQRQRIAIARAILKNAPILILDEATSQLDSITEQHIQESLSSLMQGKTTLVIAHRLSTLLHMDRILVFDNGIIKEDGSHQALLNQNGLYKELWDAQIGGFLPEEHKITG